MKDDQLSLGWSTGLAKTSFGLVTVDLFLDKRVRCFESGRWRLVSIVG